MSEYRRGDPELTEDTYMNSPSKKARERKLKSALKLQEKINQTDVSIYKECLETIEKIQYGKELDPWDECNLQYTIEDLIRFIIEESEK